VLAKLHAGDRDLLDTERFSDLFLAERGLFKEPADNPHAHVGQLAPPYMPMTRDPIPGISEVVTRIEMLRVHTVPNVASVADDLAFRH
jgi:hypothetical protein